MPERPHDLSYRDGVDDAHGPSALGVLAGLFCAVLSLASAALAASLLWIGVSVLQHILSDLSAKHEDSTPLALIVCVFGALILLVRLRRAVSTDVPPVQRQGSKTCREQPAGSAWAVGTAEEGFSEFKCRTRHDGNVVPVAPSRRRRPSDEYELSMQSPSDDEHPPIGRGA